MTTHKTLIIKEAGVYPLCGMNLRTLNYKLADRWPKVTCKTCRSRKIRRSGVSGNPGELNLRQWRDGRVV